MDDVVSRLLIPPNYCEVLTIASWRSNTETGRIMCTPLYPAEAVVIIQSKYDDHFWMVTSSNKVKKLTMDDMVREFSNCYNSMKVTFCPEEGNLLIWSKNGKAAIGVMKADVFDEAVWCNIERFAELVRDKLPEPILPSDLEAARFEITWLLSSPSVQKVLAEA